MRDTACRDTQTVHQCTPHTKIHLGCDTSLRKASSANEGTETQPTQVGTRKQQNIKRRMAKNRLVNNTNRTITGALTKAKKSNLVSKNATDKDVRSMSL